MPVGVGHDVHGEIGTDRMRAQPRGRAASEKTIQVAHARTFVDLEAHEDEGSDGEDVRESEYEHDFVDDAEMPERRDHAISGLVRKRAADQVEDLGAGPSAKRSDHYKRTIRDLEERYAHSTDPEETKLEASAEDRLSDDEEDFTVDPSDTDFVEPMDDDLPDERRDYMPTLIRSVNNATQTVLFPDIPELENDIVWAMSFTIRSEAHRHRTTSWIVHTLRSLGLPPVIRFLGHLPKYPGRLYVVASDERWREAFGVFLLRISRSGSLKYVAGAAGEGSSGARLNAPIEKSAIASPREAQSRHFERFVQTAPVRQSGSHHGIDASSLEIRVGQARVARGAHASLVLHQKDGRAQMKVAYWMKAPEPCWVRVLCGPYKGDLGVLAWRVEDDNGGMMSFVLVVPRIQGLENEPAPLSQPFVTEDGRIGSRPAPAHFSRDIEHMKRSDYAWERIGRCPGITIRSGDRSSTDIASSTWMIAGPFEFACLTFAHEPPLAGALAPTKPSDVELDDFGADRLTPFFAHLGRANEFSKLVQNSSWVPAIGTPVLILSGELKGFRGRVCGRREGSSLASVKVVNNPHIGYDVVESLEMDRLDHDLKVGHEVRFLDARGAEKKGVVIDIWDAPEVDPSILNLAYVKVVTSAEEVPVVKLARSCQSAHSGEDHLLSTVAADKVASTRAPLSKVEWVRDDSRTPVAVKINGDELRPHQGSARITVARGRYAGSSGRILAFTKSERLSLQLLRPDGSSGGVIEIEPAWCGQQQVTDRDKQKAAAVAQPLVDLMLHVEAAKRDVILTGALVRMQQKVLMLHRIEHDGLVISDDGVTCGDKFFSLRDRGTQCRVGQAEPYEIEVGGVPLRRPGWAAVACGPLTGKRGIITHIGVGQHMMLTLMCTNEDGTKEEVIARRHQPAEDPMRARAHFLCGKMVLVHAGRKGWGRVESVNELNASIVVVWDVQLVSGAQRKVFHTADIVGMDPAGEHIDLSHETRLLPNAKIKSYIAEVQPRAVTPPWTGHDAAPEAPAWDAADYLWDDHGVHFIDGHWNARVLLTKAFNTGSEWTRMKTPTKKLFVRASCDSLPALHAVQVSTHDNLEVARKRALSGVDRSGAEVLLWPEILPSVHLVPMAKEPRALAVCVGGGNLSGRLATRGECVNPMQCLVTLKGVGSKGAVRTVQVSEWVACTHAKQYSE